MSTKLVATPRDQVGSRQSQRLRSEGRIPAALQAQGAKPQVSLSIDEQEFMTARRHHEHVFLLTLPGESTSVLVDELQWDPFGERILHVEFRRVDLTKKTRVEVALVFIGHPKSGLVNHLVTEIAVNAKPEDIPDSIEVRVDGLEPGTAIFARDLVLPPEIDLLVSPDLHVAHIVLPVVEVAPEAPAAEVVAAGAVAAPGAEAKGPEARGAEAKGAEGAKAEPKKAEPKKGDSKK
jgi:large subunit ribosomal protein L25